MTKLMSVMKSSRTIKVDFLCKGMDQGKLPAQDAKEQTDDADNCKETKKLLGL